MSVKREDVKCEHGRTRNVGASGAGLSWIGLVVALLVAPAGAQPTQEEVFKSVADNVNEPVDSGRVLGVIAGIAGVVVLVAVVGQRRGRDGAPKALHHHGKLVKEVLRALPLKGAEVKQLKAIVQDVLPKAGGDAPESPITLLLCPSLLARAAQANSDKIDRRLVAGLVKRLVGRG